MPNSSSKEEKPIKIKIKKRRLKGLFSKKEPPGKQVEDIKKEKIRKVEPPPSRVIEIKEGKKERKKIYLKTKIIGILIILFAVATTIGLYWVLIGRFTFNSYKLAKYVPSEAIFYTRIDINNLDKEMEGAKIQKISYKFSNFDKLENSFYAKINEVLDLYGLNYKTDVRPYLVDYLSLALISEKENYTLLVLAKIKEKEVVASKLERIFKEGEVQEKTYKENSFKKIISKDKKKELYFVFFEDVLVLGPSEKSIKDVIDIKQGERLSLAKSSYFKKVKRNFSQNPVAAIYLKPDETLGYLKLFYQDKLSTLPISSLVADYQTVGFSLDITDKGVKIESIALGKNEPQKNKWSLFGFLPSKQIATFYGANFRSEFLALEEDLKEKNPVVYFALKNIRQEVAKKYNFDFYEDFLDFVDKEFSLILLPKLEDKLNLAFVFRIEDRAKIEEKLKKAEDAMATYFGETYPKENKIKLEDGSEAIELLPNKEAFYFSDLKYENVAIRSIINENLKTSFSYAFYENELVLATSLEAAKVVIDAKKGNNALIKNQDFNENFNNIFSSKSQSFLYLDVPAVFTYFGIGEETIKSLSPLRNLIFTSYLRKESVFGRGLILIK